MKSLGLLAAFGAAAAAVAVAAACSDDEGLVRNRLDGSDAATADSGSSCGITIPTTYESPTFETNAAQELALRHELDEFLAPMVAVEAQLAADAAATPVTYAQLNALWSAGTPSVKTTTTAYYQAKVAAWLTAYGMAVTDGAYVADVPDVPDGGDQGGALGGHVFDAYGVDLLQAIEKGSYAAAFYNQAASLIAIGPITTGTIDRLVASFGASPAFPNNDNAAQNRDVLAAAFAARRDSKDVANPGPYQRIRTALIKAKASVEAGAKCDADRDAALVVFLAQWEQSTYASVVYDFNDIIAKLSASDFPGALHEYAEAVGFVSSFKTISQSRRIITDAQIDNLLQQIYAADGAPVEAYKLKTTPIDAVSRLQQGIGTIKGIYGFSDAQIESFKQNY